MYIRIHSDEENLFFSTAEKKYRKFSHTGFQYGFVDFNLSSDWLLVVRVRKVVEGLRTGGTGVTIEHAFARTGCSNCKDFIKNSDQLEDTENI